MISAAGVLDIMVCQSCRLTLWPQCDLQRHDTLPPRSVRDLSCIAAAGSTFMHRAIRARYPARIFFVAFRLLSKLDISAFVDFISRY